MGNAFSSKKKPAVPQEEVTPVQEAQPATLPAVAEEVQVSSKPMEGYMCKISHMNFCIPRWVNPFGATCHKWGNFIKNHPLYSVLPNVSYVFEIIFR